MKLAIVIPTYNRLAYVQSAIHSCLTQFDVENCQIQIVVVDDGSTDGTSEILQTKLGNQIHLLKIVNSERGAARNRGAEYAINQLQVDWLLFLDADDCLDPYSISYFKRFENTDADLISAKYVLWFQSTQFGGECPDRSNISSSKKEDILENDFLPLGATLIRTTLFQKIKGFIEDRNLSGSEDRVFVMKAGLNGNIIFSDHISTLYRQHEENTNLERFSVSMRLALKYIEPEIYKCFPSKGTWAMSLLSQHISFLLLGAHNANLQKGHPFQILWRIIFNDPSVLFNKRVWRYIFSIIKRQTFYFAKTFMWQSERSF